MEIRKAAKKYLGNFETKKVHIFDMLILFLIFIDLIVTVLDSYIHLNLKYGIYFDLFNYVIIGIFTLEIFLRFYITLEKKDFFNSKYNLLDIVAVVPFYLGLEYFEVLRVLRFFKIFRYTNKFFLNNDSSVQVEKLFVLRILFVTFITLYFASSSFLHFEKGINSLVTNFGDSFYFTLVTITTVGFGDITPLTFGGKLTTMILIVFGLLIIPWSTGFLIKHVVYSNTKTQYLCPKCKLMYHDRDARFCKNCATRIYLGQELKLNNLK